MSKNLLGENSGAYLSALYQDGFTVDPDAPEVPMRPFRPKRGRNRRSARRIWIEQYKSQVLLNLSRALASVVYRSEPLYPEAGHVDNPGLSVAEDFASVQPVLGAYLGETATRFVNQPGMPQAAPDSYDSMQRITPIAA